MRLVSFISSFGLLLACTPDPLTETSLPFFGGGYRADGDQCRRLGESVATTKYLDHTADLVGCPEVMENLGVFVIETGAVEVFRPDGYVVYSVPNGG